MLILPLRKFRTSQASAKEKGDLGDMFVFKFRSQNQLYLLGYKVKDTLKLITLEANGPHENFYRDLKK